MNNEPETKRRGWIKNVAIIFLAVLLLLTFFSNTILTYSLPEVSAQYGQYSSLSSSVKLTGTVKANESYKVIYEPTEKDGIVQSRKVKSVYVREGDYVEKDQPILVVAGGMSDELKSLQDQYDSLKKAYDLALAGDNVSYLQTSKTLEDAQKRYDEAKEEYDKLNVQYENLMKGASSEADKEKRAEEIKAERKKLNAEIAEVEKRVTEIKLKLDEAKGIAGGGMTTSLAEEERKFREISDTYENLKSEESSMKTELDTLSKSIADMREANGFTREIESLEEQNRALYQNLENIDYQAIADNNQKISEAKQKLNILGLSKVSDIELFAAEHNLSEYQEDYNSVSAEYSSYIPVYEEAKAKIETLRKQNTASSEVNEYTSLLNVYESQLEDLKKTLEETVEIDELKTALKSAENNMKSAKSDLEIIKATTSQSNQSTNLDRKDQKKQLDELLVKIEEYKNAPETLVVKAPIGGRVVSVYAVPGENVMSGATVADIEIADKGYTCEITVSTEEARKIAVGSPVTIANSWWYSNMEASIIQIRSDVQSQGKNKIVVFEIKGDVYDGQQVTFSVGDRSASYDNVFPNSAIRDDSEGKFVLVVDSKKTPLGIRYTARRVKVEIVASDDTKSSLSGLMGGEFVITNATVPIADGQMVRLAEN